MKKYEYFAPKIEDICSGYEYEVLNGGIWKKINEFSNAYMYDDNPHYEILKDIEEGKIRVPYLTKEQIENEGWIFTQQIGNTLFFKKKDFELTFNDNYININNFGEYDLGYWGNCKDINTFRYICKLLEI